MQSKRKKLESDKHNKKWLSKWLASKSIGVFGLGVKVFDGLYDPLIPLFIVDWELNLIFDHLKRFDSFAIDFAGQEDEFYDFDHSLLESLAYFSGCDFVAMGLVFLPLLIQHIELLA